MKKRSDVLEWIYKAEQDYQTAVTMGRKRKDPVPDIVGFHCQQCIEKYLKAYLVLQRRDFPKTHDLLELLEAVIKEDPLIDAVRSDLRILNPFSVQFRYPGESASIDDAQLALKTMRSLRLIFRDKVL
jgi:HEPN domain-containing protein